MRIARGEMAFKVKASPGEIQAVRQAAPGQHGSTKRAKASKGAPKRLPLLWLRIVAKTNNKRPEGIQFLRGVGNGFELRRTCEAAGASLCSAASHPGIVRTLPHGFA
jgi:hypothetical protein